jgi:hypothetical protein
MMDFTKLLEPYSEDGKRTIGGQIKWLLREYPQHSIDHAMASVYTDLEAGMTFPDGNALDQELKKVTDAFHTKELHEQMEARIAGIKTSLDSEWNALSRTKKLWEVIRGRA